MANIFYLNKGKDEDKYYSTKNVLYKGLFNKEGKLEKIVLAEEPKIVRRTKNIYSFNYQNKQKRVSDNEDVTSEVEFIAGGEGWQVLGMYIPSEDKVYILKGLDPWVKEYVKQHEWEHRRRAYSGESQDERLVDMAAEKKLGYSMNRYAA